MSLKGTVKFKIKTILDAFKIRPMHFGVNLYDDIKRRLPNQQFSIILDVGANVGQTAVVLREQFSRSAIHCFEPNPECCATLSALGKSLTVHQLALGDTTGTIGFDRSQGQSDMYFVTTHETGEEVQIDTLDNFAKQNNIDHIDFLKIDTEGFDLRVIHGSMQMLSNQKIDLVQAEVSMNADNKYHVPFFEIHQLMERLEYRLFGIYEQGVEWGKNAPYLRRSNIVYISPRVAEANKLW